MCYGSKSINSSSFNNGLNIACSFILSIIRLSNQLFIIPTSIPASCIPYSPEPYLSSGFLVLQYYTVKVSDKNLWKKMWRICTNIFTNSLVFVTNSWQICHEFVTECTTRWRCHKLICTNLWQNSHKFVTKFLQICDILMG